MNENYKNYRKNKRAALKRKKHIKHGVLLVTAVLLFVIAVISVPAFGRISPGLTYKGVSLGTKSESGAKTALKNAAATFDEREITLRAGSRAVRTDAHALGLSYDPGAVAAAAMKLSRDMRPWERIGACFAKREVAMPLAVNEKKLARTLFSFDGTLYDLPLPARPVADNGDAVRIEKGEAGEVPDVKAAKDALALYDGAPVKIETTAQEPALSAEALSGIDGVLAMVRSDYTDSDRDRKANVENGASYFRRIVLSPEEKISFLQEIGGITEAHGFRKGEIVENGRMASGIGGGVCQVSTALYNAAEEAGLTVLTKFNHSRPVPYAEEGLDCAVVDGYKDLIFKNSYKTPVYIEMWADGKELVCKIYGPKAEKPYAIELATERVATIPAGEQRELSSQLKAGEERVEVPAVDGSVYKTYRIFKEGGREVRRELAFTSRYVPSAGKILVGEN